MMMVLAGCGGAPADTVNRFFNAVKSEKYTAAASFCALDDEERAQFSILGAKLKVALDKKQVTVGKATVAGDGKRRQAFKSPFRARTAKKTPRRSS